MTLGIQNFSHIVVLMFENRSFDHLFGAFPGVNGVLDEAGHVKPGLYNLADPTQPANEATNPPILPFAITPDVPLNHDFFHDFSGMMPELFGPLTSGWSQSQGAIDAPATTYPATNSGFYSAAAYNVDPDGGTINGLQDMSYYSNGSLKVLHRLASEFVLCDNWFCDTPGDTLLNRFFMHAATANGELSDSQGLVIDVPTIFDRIEAADETWKMYAPWADIDGQTVSNRQIDTRFFPSVQNSPNTNLPVTQFAEDLASGTLPFYSFLMCWLPLNQNLPDTSMHPNSDVRVGENYLAAVYNALRNSPHWEDTLLIVTFDENGGIYDHVPPRTTVAPDDKTGSLLDPYRSGIQLSFDFTLLGPRIPVLMVSPWLSSGIAGGQYQNTSVLRMIHDRIGSKPLTLRDANAPQLDAILAEFGLAQPRTDCPASMPGYENLAYADGDLCQTYSPPPDAAAAEPSEGQRRQMAHIAAIYRIDEADDQCSAIGG